jgi:LPS sulfotransferase NodH
MGWQPARNAPERTVTDRTPPLEVIVVVGCSRSGSTLLGALLEQVPGFLHVGELHHLWKRCFQQNWPCECSRGFHECEFWQEVVGRAFPDEPPSPSAMRRLRRKAHKGNPAARRDYAAVTERFLRAAGEFSGARAIVDTSKNVDHARTLLAAGGLDVSPVHMVRHPLAVVHSLARQRPLPGPNGETIEMARMGPVNAILHWRRETSRAVKLVEETSGTTVRYDDLTADPTGALRELLDHLGQPGADLDFLDDHEAHITAGHSLSGNPMRHGDGVTEIRRDREWATAVSPWVRRAGLLVSWSLRRRLGWR